ncbi:MAG: asparagine synthase-related protein [Candidatus Cloacimonetes bacterium]|nr:asparagine synthase-related protein [Candidatus Cloacimonadota bacterium]
MPGINCLINAKGITPQNRNTIDLHLQRFGATFPHLQLANFMPCSEVLLTFSQHQGYQVYTESYKGWQIFHELQDNILITQTVTDILEQVENNSISLANLRKSWNMLLHNTYESFFLLAVNPDLHKIIFANDALARLPIYYTQQKDCFILGRDISWVKAISDQLTLNPLFMALYLSNAYIPGRGTFYQEIDTLASGTFAIYDWLTDDLQMISQPNMRFVEPLAGRAEKKRLNELVETFMDVCVSYRTKLPKLLSLSGGMDSRCVAGALQQKSIDFVPISFLDFQKEVKDDVFIASQIAELYHKSHNVIHLSLCEPEHYENLFYLMAGLNYLPVAMFLQYLEKILAQYPQSALFLTGDGGDKVMRYLLPDKELADEKQWLNYWYSQNAIIPTKDSAAIFGIPEKEMDEYLLNHLSTYPTGNYNYKYASAILAERSARWAFEGEDRNRYFFRSETPFFDFRFYQLAMQIPMEQKKDNVLYYNFLYALSPSLAKLRYARYQWSPAKMRNIFYRILVNQTRKIRLKYRSHKEAINHQQSFAEQDYIVNWILEQSQKSIVKEIMPGAKSFLNLEYLQNLSPSQLGTLFTSISVITGGPISPQK